VIITSETAFFVSHLYLAENKFVAGTSHDIEAGRARGKAVHGRRVGFYRFSMR
jgi:hypothetical protein